MKKYTRLQILIAILFSLVSLLILLMSYIVSNREISTRANNKLEIELETTELEVELFFSHFSHTLVDTSAYIHTFGITDLLSYIKAIHQNHEKVASIYLVGEDIFINSTDYVPSAEFDYETRNWYTMAILHNTLIVTPATLNDSKDFYISTLAMPIYQNDLLLGVLAMDIHIDTIENYIGSKTIGETGYVLLIDSNMEVITFPSHWSFDRETIHLDDIGINLSDLTENEINKNIKVNDQVGTLLYTDLLLDDYYLIVFIPNDEYYAVHQQNAQFFIILFVLFNLVGISFILHHLKYITIPLNHLSNDLTKIDVKNNLKYRIPNPRSDAFKEIKEIINQTLGETESYFNESMKSHQNFLIENQRFKHLMSSTQDFILHYGLDHNIIFADGKGLYKFVQNPKDMVNCKFEDIFGHDHEQHFHKLNLALRGKNVMFDWETNDNTERFVFETSISPVFNSTHEIIGAVSISRDVTYAKIKQEEIEYINEHDYLTGLYNRRKFKFIFDELISLDHYPIGLMMMDLNGLKMINDAFGHLSGDQALVKVSKVLKEELNDHFVARIGGDEFAAIVCNYQQGDLEIIKDRIINQVSLERVDQMQLSISIGYEVFYEKGHSFNEIMKIAENNMYRQKITESMSVRNNAIKAIHKTLTDKYREERIHSERVSQLCYVTGVALNLSSDQLKELRLAGMYHDIGKIAIPDAILEKPDKLTPEEYEIIKTHTELGYNILRAADGYSRLAEYALTHHERWDGLGYPRNLVGEQIPLIARIITIADSYDAMTSNRLYRKKLGKAHAVAEIIKESGKQFDPYIARVFVEKVLLHKWIDQKDESV